MDRFLLIYRGPPHGAAESWQHDPQRWADWFATLGSRVLDQGALSHGSVDMDTRLAGPKSSSSSLAGYSVVAATDFNDAVKLAEKCPIFDEQGALEIAHLA